MIIEYFGLPGTGKSFLARHDSSNGFILFPDSNLKNELKKSNLSLFVHLIKNSFYLLLGNHNYFIKHPRFMVKICLLISYMQYFEKRNKNIVFEQGIVQEIWAISTRSKSKIMIEKLLTLVVKKIYSNRRYSIDLKYTYIDLDTNINRIINRKGGTSYLDNPNLTNYDIRNELIEGEEAMNFILEYLEQNNIPIEFIENKNKRS